METGTGNFRSGIPEIIDILLSRRGIRQLTAEPVDKETLVLLLKAAMAAPTACDFKGDPDCRSFAIETLDGEFVGWINLFLGEPRHGRFSLGVSIFREYQRRGYALDAAKMILQYGLNELCCHKCNSACLEFNTGSIAFHQKLGFVEEGRRRAVIAITTRSCMECHLMNSTAPVEKQ